ncbi:MFS transporter [Pseudonocardia sp. N23]|uniref:MFS transporter n=1 Tax=Pseudonocardia sp. N23 TaxID=1987376 RepID=UPI000BFD436D|nr:MFS transporter [Pseudonocardia sp. N23]GAY12508.1 putative efflux membrane protein [Pseudonocardia sp. N23]
MTDATPRRRSLILAICCSSLFVVSLDNTIVNVALPSVARDLGSSLSALQWVVDAYLLVLASLLMLAGSTGDRIGRRRIFQIGLGIFGLGSLLCSLAPTTGSLIAFRMVQAVGGSMMNPVAMSIITNTFPDRRERARAIGMWGSVAGISMALGPLLGGVLVDAVGWRSIFWVNVPVTVAAIVLTARYVPESRSDRPRRVDPLGQVLIVALLGGVTFGIIETPARGIGSPAVLGAFAVALVAAVVLVPVELRRREPLLDPRFFRSVSFSSATVIAVAAFAALAGFLFLNALYLQGVRGYSALHAGLLTLPMAAGVALLPPLSGRLVGTRGPRIPLVVGGIGLAAGGVLLTTLADATPIALLMVAYVVFGIGSGMVNAPITYATVSGMPPSQAGVAAAVASTSRQVGSALGIAVLGAIVTAGTTGAGATGLAQASHTAWWVVTGCGIGVAVLGVVCTSGWGRRVDDRAAEVIAAHAERRHEAATTTRAATT